MIQLDETMSILTIILILVVGAIQLIGKTLITSTVKESAKSLVEKLNWPEKLTRELQKTRGVERQELRYRSYGMLWKELRPLSIYDSSTIDKKLVRELAKKLSDWYFSEVGGLLLTSQAREYYFALQLLLDTTANESKNWKAQRIMEPEEKADRKILEQLLKERCKQAISVLEYFDQNNFIDWQNKAKENGDSWKIGIRAICKDWNELTEEDRFAVFQQVGSKLRTSLVADLESRIQ